MSCWVTRDFCIVKLLSLWIYSLRSMKDCSWEANTWQMVCLRVQLKWHAHLIKANRWLIIITLQWLSSISRGCDDLFTRILTLSRDQRWTREQESNLVVLAILNDWLLVWLCLATVFIPTFRLFLSRIDEWSWPLLPINCQSLSLSTGDCCFSYWLSSTFLIPFLPLFNFADGHWSKPCLLKEWMAFALP